MSEPELLRYRSNLLGRDLRITNFGGGNTSAKLRMPDPLTGEPVEVLWVKGSGGDLGSSTLDSFATLYLDKLEQLTKQYRGREHEDEMPARFAHCTFDLNPRAPSIDTPLHAFIPHRHIDHMHAEALIAFAASANGERLTREAFGDELAWVGWQRPGFDLGLTVGRIARERPQLKGIVLGGHGLLTWGSTSRECYQTTLAVIRRAAEWLDAHARATPLGPAVAAPLVESERHCLLRAIAPDAARAALAARAKGDAPRRLSRRARIRGVGAVRDPGREGHDVPGPFSADARAPDVRPVRARPRDRRRSAGAPARARRPVPARSTRPTTSGAGTRTPLPCAIRTR